MIVSLCFISCQVIVGVHSDESYVKLKNKHAIDNIETRMANVKKYADQVGCKRTVNVFYLLQQIA